MANARTICKGFTSWDLKLSEYYRFPLSADFWIVKHSNPQKDWESTQPWITGDRQGSFGVSRSNESCSDPESKELQCSWNWWSRLPVCKDLRQSRWCRQLRHGVSTDYPALTGERKWIAWSIRCYGIAIVRKPVDEFLDKQLLLAVFLTITGAHLKLINNLLRVQTLSLLRLQ